MGGADTLSQWIKKYLLQIFLMSLVAIFAVVTVWLYGFREQLKKAPHFSMQNVDGRIVSLDSTDGKVRIFYFYFINCPDVCPPTTYLLAKVQKLLKERGVYGQKANIVSISFDPKRDTIKAIQQWSQKYNADYSGWYFLRGKEEEVTKIMSALGSDKTKDKEGNFIHLNVITLVDQKGNIRKIYNANNREQTSPEIIVEDVMRLLK